MKRKLTILLILLMSMVTSHAINTVKVKNVLVSQGGKANIVVELANSESVTAFTMKLVLPQGVDYVSFSKNDSRFSDHELWDGSINSNKTFGCLSAQNSPIAGTNGTLLTITINADASLHEGTELTATMKDITLSTTSLSEITLEDVTFKIIVKFMVDEDAAGIEGITPDMEDGVWYTLDGRQLNGKPAEKGVYIVNNKKVLIK